MIIGDLNIEVAAAQLRLLFDIRSIFKRRGRKVASFENLDELLFDPTTYGAVEKYYPIFHSSTFRRVLRTVANSEDGLTIDTVNSLCAGLTGEQIKETLDMATQLQLLVSRNDKYIPAKRIGFGPTFEWYVAQICMEELASVAYWGVRVENFTGDYDVILIRENQIGYIECKSGNLSNINSGDIKNFLERERVLAPQFSMYLVDGISREKLGVLIKFALEQQSEYEFEIPGVMNTDVSLEAEDYKNFVRLIPINSFFITAKDPIASTLKEVYEFLTLVCDRSLPTENTAAKRKFR